MINMLLFLLFIACAGIVSALLAENSGIVTMLWFDYQIETSVAFLIISILLTAILMVLFTLLIRNIIFAPSRFWKKRNEKLLKLGISELTYSVAALASSDIESAENHTRKVEKLLGPTPLTLLLSAQIAKSRGDEAKTQILLEKLLEYKETEYLAARFLSDGASKQENLPKALQLAQKAHVISPKDNASAIAVISLQVRLKKWDEALANAQRLKLPRKEKKRIGALIQLALGESFLADARDEQALILARNVISVLPDFTPAIVFTAHVYNENNMYNKAVRLLTNAWKKNQAQVFLDTMNSIISHEPHERKEKLLALFKGGVSDGIWQCKTCTHSQKIWQLHCDSCQDFNSLEWK